MGAGLRTTHKEATFVQPVPVAGAGAIAVSVIPICYHKHGALKTLSITLWFVIHLITAQPHLLLRDL